MPEAAVRVLLSWHNVYPSPYNTEAGGSFYDKPGVTWETKPEGVLRLSDHWNWRDQQGRMHGATSQTVAEGRWALAHYQGKDATWDVLRTFRPADRAFMVARLWQIWGPRRGGTNAWLRWIERLVRGETVAYRPRYNRSARMFVSTKRTWENDLYLIGLVAPSGGKNATTLTRDGRELLLAAATAHGVHLRAAP